MISALKRQLDFDKQLSDPNFVLIYQMGKIGSSSIESSLEALNIPNWHVHTFDDNEEFQIYRNTADVKCFFDASTRFAYKCILAHRRRILQRQPKLKIITLVRDPVATVVSRFFQDLHIQFIEGKKNKAIHGDVQQTLSHLTDSFEKQMNLHYFTDWFDNELKHQFSIDVLQAIDDPSRTHWRVQQQGKDILLLKCEAMNDSQSIISDFLGRDDFTLLTSNDSAQKWYSALYREFKEHYPFKKLFHLYDAPLYRKVYSEEDIEGFKAKWDVQ